MVVEVTTPGWQLLLPVRGAGSGIRVAQNHIIKTRPVHTAKSNALIAQRLALILLPTAQAAMIVRRAHYRFDSGVDRLWPRIDLYCITSRHSSPRARDARGDERKSSRFLGDGRVAPSHTLVLIQIDATAFEGGGALSSANFEQPDPR